MDEELIIGQENNQMFMKVNLKVEKDMEEEHFGGLMEVGMKDNLNKVFNLDVVVFIDKVV